MVIFYLTIPLMLVAIAIAVVPLVWVSVRDANSQRAIATVGSRRSAFAEEAAASEVTGVETYFENAA